MSRVLHPKTLEELQERLIPIVPGTVEPVTMGSGTWMLASWTDGPTPGMIAAAVIGDRKPRQRTHRGQRYNALMTETYEFSRGHVNLLCHRRITPVAQALAVIDWFIARGCTNCRFRADPRTGEPDSPRRYGSARTPTLQEYEFGADPSRPAAHQHVATVAELIGDEPIVNAATYLAVLSGTEETADPATALPEITALFCHTGHLRGLLDVAAVLDEPGPPLLACPS